MGALEVRRVFESIIMSADLAGCDNIAWRNLSYFRYNFVLQYEIYIIKKYDIIYKYDMHNILFICSWCVPFDGNSCLCFIV